MKNEKPQLKIKNLEKIFKPQSVVLIGATDRVGSVGLGIAKNLMQGKSQRKIFFVNPNSKKVLKQKTFKSILEVKEEIDLAIIAVPSKFVEQISQECVEAKVKACIIISSGFAETGNKGENLQKRIAEIFKENNIPLIGPNCLGVINPSENLNASFAPDIPKQGSIAFLSQSGALIDSVIDKSLLEGFGFSLMVSYGNEAGLSLNDFLKIASQDKNTKVIAVYLEEIKNGQEFIKITSEITKTKPIVVLKGGKTQEGKKAVQSHTASLAGDEKIYSAVFKKAGVIEVETIEDLFLISQALSIYNNHVILTTPPPVILRHQPKDLPDTSLIAQGDKEDEHARSGWAILTNGGAVGVIVADWCSRLKVRLSKIPEQVFKDIEESKKVNLSFSKNNPLDIIGDASSESYKVSLDSLLKQEGIKGVIFCQTLQTMTSPKENAKIIIEAQKKFPQKPILALFLGGKITQEGINLLKENNIATFQEPRDIALVASILNK